MPRTHTFPAVLDDRETEIAVEFTVTHYGQPAQTLGPAEYCDPGEAPEIDIDAAYRLDNGEVVTLTPAERERIEREIIESPDAIPDDAPEADDQRDRMIDDRLTDPDYD